MFRWQAHKGAIQSLAFSPAADLLATATGSTRSIHLWDPRTGKRVRKLEAGGAVQAVAFAPGAPLVAAAVRGLVRVWETGAWDWVADLDNQDAYELAFGHGPRPALAAAAARNVLTWSDAS